MPSISAVGLILKCRLYDYAEKQNRKKREFMLLVLSKMNKFNECWFWQRDKKEIIKQELNELYQLHPDWYVELRNEA